MDARVYVYGLNGVDPEESEDVSFYSVGDYEYSPEEQVIEYPESAMTGLAGAKTKVTVRPGKVTVERTGTVESCMVFERGKKCYFAYGTPSGKLMMGLNTDSISSTLNDRGGQVELKYVLDYQGMMPADMKVLIKVSTGGERL